MRALDNPTAGKRPDKRNKTGRPPTPWPVFTKAVFEERLEEFKRNNQASDTWITMPAIQRLCDVGPGMVRYRFASVTQRVANRTVVPLTELWAIIGEGPKRTPKKQAPTALTLRAERVEAEVLRRFSLREKPLDIAVALRLTSQQILDLWNEYERVLALSHPQCSICKEADCNVCRGCYQKLKATIKTRNTAETSQESSND